METTYFKHTDVNPDGTIGKKRLGAVHTDRRITMSKENGGCGLDSCGGSEGHWICVIKGRTDNGVVEGKTIRFKNKREMNNFLSDINVVSLLWENW